MFLSNFVEKSHLNLLQPTSKIPLAYLVSRGLSLDEIKRYRIGLSPSYYSNISEDSNDSVNFNRWLGYKGKYISNRLVFPIFDEVGNITGIETRSLDKRSMGVLSPKYREALKEAIENLPENEVRYKKFYLESSKFRATFFGLPDSLPSIWESREVFLTEGIFDMITLNKIKPNCLSPLTANINNYQIEWLKRYVNKVIVIFDADSKGKESSERIKNMLKNEITVYSIPILGKDISDFVQNKGIKEFEYYLNDKLDNIF